MSIYLLFIRNSKILINEQLDKTKSGQDNTREIAFMATRTCANTVNMQVCII